MKKNPLNYLMVIGVVGIATAAIAAYAGTPFKSVKAFSVVCGTTATLINNGDGGYNSIRCDNKIDTNGFGVYFGDSGVTRSPFTGYHVCQNSAACSDSALTLDASMNVYCISDQAASPAYINCIAGK